MIDALSYWGVTQLDIPFTAEKVWSAINGKQPVSTAQRTSSPNASSGARWCPGAAIQFENAEEGNVSQV